MIWLLRDFDLLAVLLHAAVLALEALLLGGVAFLLFPARSGQISAAASRGCSRLLRWSSVGLIAAEVATMAITSATMLSGSSLTWRDLLSASFLHAESLTIAFALLLRWLARSRSLRGYVLMVLSSLAVLLSIVYLSHATSQLSHRLLLAALTALHHLGTAAWIGAMPYLLLSLVHDDNTSQTQILLRRYSTMAFIGVMVLVAAGIGMAWFYVGSVNGLYGTSYGLMLLAKIYLLLFMLTLGSANWYLLRVSGDVPAPLLLRLRRFSEAEVGLGFMVLLAAASLTAQSPSSEIQPQDMVSSHAYREQMAPRFPRLSSPPFRALTPPTSIRQGVEDHQFGDTYTDDANDKAWSDYNHHWAGVMVLLAGMMALLSSVQKLRWARYWPLVFAGLALFILLRADPEAWPLGPRPFWASFSYPDVLAHRLEAALIIAFAVFESSVQAGKLRSRWAPLIFPCICALGSALLLTHSHGLGNMSAEVLAEASHTLIALLGATICAARWLQLRLAPGRVQQMAAVTWPVAMILAALVLLNYREV